MKKKVMTVLVASVVVFGCSEKVKQTANVEAPEKKLFLDVHNIGPGKVTFDAVAGAHQKDLATQGEFDTNFIKYWVDEKAGKVYCLAESASETNLYKTHEKAHGLLPAQIMEVKDGPEAKMNGRELFLDVHHFEPGTVTAEAVSVAHEKDLATQKKYDVNFINYWVDEKSGTVVCLSEAPDSLSVIKTHTEAHGLIPTTVEHVKQGN